MGCLKYKTKKSFIMDSVNDYWHVARLFSRFHWQVSYTFFIVRNLPLKNHNLYRYSLHVFYRRLDYRNISVVCHITKNQFLIFVDSYINFELGSRGKDNFHDNWKHALKLCNINGPNNILYNFWSHIWHIRWHNDGYPNNLDAITKEASLKLIYFEN